MLKRKSPRRKKPRSARVHGPASGRYEKRSAPSQTSGLPVLADGEAVRRQARLDHDQARATMESIEKELEKFERQDLPAYHRWMYLNFGPLLTELRAVDQAASAKEAILERIDFYCFWENISSVQAYAKVKREGENPDPDLETEFAYQKEEKTNYEAFSDQSEQDLRDMYEFTRRVFEREFGTDAPSFEEFKRLMDAEKAEPAINKVSDREKERIKRLYRRIARHLHPDCSGRFSPWEQQLWLRAQQAYKKGNVNELETVLSHIEASDTGPLFASTLSDLLQSTREMKARITFLEEELREARRHPAWKFTQKSSRRLDSLRQRTEQEIIQALNQARSDLASAEAELLKLEIAYARTLARKPKPARSKGMHSDPRQTSFSF